MGNTFDVNTVKYGHARKVWREIRHRYPGGGMVSNISDWVAVGKIPAGTAVKFDLSGKTFTAYTDAQIKALFDDVEQAAYHSYKALNQAIAQHLMQGDLQENLDRL